MTKAITLSGFSADQIQTIKRTVSKDHNDLEFDLFMEACRSYGLDPFRKQIFSIIYSKDNAEKRKQTIIVSRDGSRVLAQRCGDYRPAETPTVYEYDQSLKGPNNPAGIVSATVTLHKQDNKGVWHPVVGQAYWDEFAPLKEEWAYDEKAGRRQPTGKFTLDTTGQWAKMSRVMISKCAEAQALRAGWPDQFGGIYQEEEMARFETDVSATQMVNEFEQVQREKMIGGRGLMMVFDDTMRLEKVPMGSVVDRCSEFIQNASPEEAYNFETRNTESLREFWAFNKADALELKKVIEQKVKQYDPNKDAA